MLIFTDEIFQSFFMKGINDRIIEARKAKKWTQMDLANALGVNVKNVSRWELGQAKPSFEAAVDLAKVLDVSLDYLAGLGGKDSFEPLEGLFMEKVKDLSLEKKKVLEVILENF